MCFYCWDALESHFTGLPPPPPLFRNHTWRARPTLTPSTHRPPPCALRPQSTPPCAPLLPPPPPRSPLFVTWTAASPSGGEGRLRGCIGSLEPRPLQPGLAEFSLTSALRDRRFPPITQRARPRPPRPPGSVPRSLGAFAKLSRIRAWSASPPV